ncbi:MAG: dihydrofolate reductase family protein [Gaiellaceae bacterium]
MSMSLDGFVADREGNAGAPYPEFDALRSSDVMKDLIVTTGAVVMGRRAYDMGVDEGYDDYEYDVPIFVATHRVPERPARGRSFRFVTEGVSTAVEHARAAADGAKVTVIGGASAAQQCLRAGMLDEIRIRLIPMLLRGGLRLFEDARRVDLEIASVVEEPTVIHLRYRVIR